MAEMQTVLEQARLFAVQHAPADVLRQAVPAGVSLLILGILLSVLGAKFARFGFTTLFVLVGAGLGISFARYQGFQPLGGAFVGALLVGMVGFLTFRVWVGVLTAFILCWAVVGFFGYHRVVPYVAEFEKGPSITALDTQFTIPTPQQQQQNLNPSPTRWAADFWKHVRDRDFNTARLGETLTAVVFLGGLCMGLVATRWALIICTSLLGTFLVTTGMAALLTHSVPQSYQAFNNNPGLIGIGIGGFLLTSLVLQTMLSRKAIRNEPAVA